MPAGDELTEPCPEPVLLTVRLKRLLVKVAVTPLAESIARMHTSPPLHAPVHPAKSDVEPSLTCRTLGQSDEVG